MTTECWAAMTLLVIIKLMEEEHSSSADYKLLESTVGLASEYYYLLVPSLTNKESPISSARAS